MTVGRALACSLRTCEAGHQVYLLLDALFFPLRFLSPAAGLCVVSLATGVLALIAFRYASNQEGIHATKEKIKAHLLAIRLFKDDPGLILRAQREMFVATFNYLGYTIVPFAVIVVPFIILALQLDLYFGYRPLQPGEAAILAVKWREQVPWRSMKPLIDLPAGLAVETAPLRIPEEKEVDWRLRATRQGRFNLRVRVDGQGFDKEVVVADRLTRISPERKRENLLEKLLPKAEPPLENNAPIEAIALRYQPASFSLFGWRLHWLVPFLALSLASGYVLGRIFRVEI